MGQTLAWRRRAGEGAVDSSQGTAGATKPSITFVMRLANRLVLLILAAPALGGCVWAFEPLALAIFGPNVSRQLADTGRVIRPDDRLAVVMANPREDAARVAACVAAAIASRLPEGQPAPAIQDAETAERILAIVHPPTQPPTAGSMGGVLPAEAGALGFDWIVTIEDRSSRHVTDGIDSTPVPGRPEANRSEVRVGQTIIYRLHLVATIADLREQRMRGSVQALVHTQGGAYLVWTRVDLSGAIVPMIEIPAGTSAMTICSALGRAVGDALAQSTSSESRPSP